MLKTDVPTVNYFSPLQESKSLFQVSFYSPKLPIKAHTTVKISLTSCSVKESSQELKLIKVWAFFQAPRMKTQPRDLIPSMPCARNTTPRVLDSPNGEPFSKSVMDAQPTFPSKKMPGDSPDMPLSAKKTESFPSLNPKSSVMVITASKSARELLNKFWPPSSKPLTITMFS